ncbi:unnamed protein product, partial [Prorocentrum cordatum]
TIASDASRAPLPMSAGSRAESPAGQPSKPPAWPAGDGRPRAARPDEVLQWEERAAAPAREAGQSESIQVAVRFRPLSAREVESGSAADTSTCVKFGQDGQSCTLRTNTLTGPVDRAFGFDQVLRPEASQAEVYDAVAARIVNGVLEGYNGAILAYGQTGSGKTHTMLGPDGASALRREAEVYPGRASTDLCLSFLGPLPVRPDHLGIVPRALQALLEHASVLQAESCPSDRAAEGPVRLRASFVEIYNESVFDLLSPSRHEGRGSEGGPIFLGAPFPHGISAGGSTVQAAMREHSGALHLPEVTETPIASVRDAMDAMRLGNRNRHQAETKMNRHSSRSHAVFIVSVINSTDKARQKFAQLYLVDLAGSERVKRTGVAGQQLEEAKSINRSLLSLGQVIWALAHKQIHVPYRDSKLTQLLRNCLGGNGRTAVVVAASPAPDDAEETLSALRFGARASLVEVTAYENVAEDARQLKRLLESARQDLNELRGHCRRLEAELAAAAAADAAALDGLGLPAEGGEPARPDAARRLLVRGLLPSLVCPLARAVMWDPVVAADGWTYERAAIERLLRAPGRAAPRSPVTGQRLGGRALVQNLVVKQLVSLYLPDLPPPRAPLPAVRLLAPELAQLLLSFLDARSLAACEASWPSFLDASNCSAAWARLLALDFPGAAEAEQPQGEQPQGRRLYAHLAATGPRSAGPRSPAPASKGLVLRRGRPDSCPASC